MPAPLPVPLLSVGYEGRTVDDVVGGLARDGASLVVDVRLTPLSRKPGLSKRSLAARLAEAGIGYLHLRALGNPPDNRADFRAGAAAARARFAAVLTDPAGADALATVVDLARRHTVALLCVEADPATCHRQLVLDAVAAELARRALVERPAPVAQQLPRVAVR